ncbi:hypothetical protein ROA7745_04182 [Roseovarius aestuarii]|uniref:Uncharacterized protein n=1 Tax=Roseovarius aestuarii TaxID=475083 RepID=A0A1X7BX78_9RHOB|nr:hypothetical protein ROA7745_04182 [Roseovarius aestuarii]
MTQATKFASLPLRPPYRPSQGLPAPQTPPNPTETRHSPLTHALRLLAAQEHAAAIKSFVSPARIDIEVSVVTSGGDVINTGEGHET